MLRIQRSANGRVVFKLSGRIEAEDVKELRELLALETAGQQLVLDLRDVILVNQDAVKFLSSCEADSIKLENCPAYIREWIDQARGRNRRRRTQCRADMFDSMKGVVMGESLLINRPTSEEEGISEEAIREELSRILESSMFIQPVVPRQIQERI
jgi:hypothetical protein